MLTQQLHNKATAQGTGLDKVIRSTDFKQTFLMCHLLEFFQGCNSCMLCFFLLGI